MFTLDASVPVCGGAGACLVSVLYISGCKCVHVRVFAFKRDRAAGVVLQV